LQRREPSQPMPADDRRIRPSPCTRAIDHRRRFGRDVVGVREYEGQLVAVIAVDGSADAPSPADSHHQYESINRTDPSTVVGYRSSSAPAVALGCRQLAGVSGLCS
jgi:hypothetical protein